MSSPEPLNRSILECGFNSSLLDRLTAIADLRGVSLGDAIRNGFGLLHTWDHLKAIGQQIVGNTGLTIIDFGIGTGNAEISGIHISSLRKIAALVEMEKPSYDAIDTKQSLYVTDDFRLRVDLYSFSQDYDSRNFALRDAALFFCNLHEILQQRFEQ